MESKKLQRPRWLDNFIGPKNSNSKWLQENLDEMNRNVRRMLKIIEDTNADSFAKKVEMYYQSRQELINLVGKCYRIHCSLAERYNHGTRELLNYIPSSDLIPSQISISNVSSGKSSAIQSPLPLSKFPSSKQLNVHESSGSKQLKRGVSVKGSNHHIKGKISKNPTITSHSMFWKLSSVVAQSESEDSSNSNYSDTQSDNDDGEELQHDEGTDDELEAELRNMIEKLYIELEGDRVVSKLQGGILRYEDIMSEDDGEFRKVKESVSSKALLEENLELQCEINRRLYLEEYTNEINEHCESLEEALIQARAEKIEAETEVEQLKASIVKKNNNVKELNKILEAVVAERDQLKVRVAMLDADPKS